MKGCVRDLVTKSSYSCFVKCEDLEYKENEIYFVEMTIETAYLYKLHTCRSIYMIIGSRML